MESSALTGDQQVLPVLVSYSDARRLGLSKRRFYQLRDAGLLEPVGHGLYRRADAPLADLDLFEIVHRAPRRRCV
jgi:hypothetical protein